jgi:hypothetical protein
MPARKSLVRPIAVAALGVAALALGIFAIYTGNIPLQGSIHVVSGQLEFTLDVAWLLLSGSFLLIHGIRMILATRR